MTVFTAKSIPSSSAFSVSLVGQNLTDVCPPTSFSSLTLSCQLRSFKPQFGCITIDCLFPRRQNAVVELQVPLLSPAAAEGGQWKHPYRLQTLWLFFYAVSGAKTFLRFVLLRQRCLSRGLDFHHRLRLCFLSPVTRQTLKLRGQPALNTERKDTCSRHVKLCWEAELDEGTIDSMRRVELERMRARRELTGVPGSARGRSAMQKRDRRTSAAQRSILAGVL